MRQTDVVTTQDLAYLRQASLRAALFCMLAVLYAWCLISFQPVNQVGAAAWGPVLLGGGLVIAFLARRHSLSRSAAAAIFSFYWTWEDFLTPLIYLNEPRLYTVSLAIRSFSDPSSTTDWGAIFAMSSLSLVPVFVIFIAFQRYLVQGISTTGLKG